MTSSNWKHNGDGSVTDLLTNLTWLPREDCTGINHHEAMAMQYGLKRLPTKEEYKTAWDNGINGVLDDSRDKDGYFMWFWCVEDGYALYAGSGHARNGSYVGRNGTTAARMIKITDAFNSPPTSKQTSETAAYLDKKIARLEKELRILKELRKRIA